jgi:hypothetical protein
MKVELLPEFPGLWRLLIVAASAVFMRSATPIAFGIVIGVPLLLTALIKKQACDVIAIVSLIVCE